MKARPTHDVVHPHGCSWSPGHVPGTTGSFTQPVSNVCTRLSILGLAGRNAGAVEKRLPIRARNKLASILLLLFSCSLHSPSLDVGGFT